MSGSKGGYSVTISVVDAATKRVDAINRRLAAVEAPVQRLVKSFGKLADTTGMTRLTHGVRNLARESFKAFENIGRIAGPLGAITGAASIAGVAKLASSFGDFGNRAANAARRADMGVVPFLNLGNAARLAGASQESMNAGMTQLKDNIFDFNAGRAAPMTIAAFNTMGISLDKVNGRLPTVTEILPKLADYLSKVADPTQRATLEMLTLGSAGASLDPLLRQGGKAVQDLTHKAASLYGVTDKQIAQAVEFHQKTEALTIATEGLGITIAADLLPAIGPVVDKMTDWITANRDWISADITGFVKAAIPEIRSFVTGVNDAVQAVGGWKTALEILLGFWTAKVVVGFLAGGARIITMFATVRAASAAAALAGAGAGAAAGAGGAGGGLLGMLGRFLPLALPLALGGDTPTGPEYNQSPSAPGFFSQGGGLETWVRGLFGGGHRASQQPPAPYKPGQILSDMNISPAQYDAFKSGVAGLENARYDQMGGSSGRFAGRYQMGRDEIAETARGLGVPVPTRFHFLHDPALQERFFEAYTDAHHKELMRSSAKYRAMTPAEKLAADAYAHNQGAGGAAKFIETGQSGRDAFGTAGSAYSDAVRRNLARLPVAQGPAANVDQGPAPGFDAAGNPLPAGWMARGAPANIQGGTGTAGRGNADTTHTVKGAASLSIKLGGFPAGTRTIATTDGGLFAGAPRIEQAMPLGAGP